MARAGGNGGGAVGAGVEEGILELLRKTKEPTQRAPAGASGQRGRRKGDGWTDLAKCPLSWRAVRGSPTFVRLRHQPFLDRLSQFLQS